VTLLLALCCAVAAGASSGTMMRQISQGVLHMISGLPALGTEVVLVNAKMPIVGDDRPVHGLEHLVAALEGGRVGLVCVTLLEGYWQGVQHLIRTLRATWRRDSDSTEDEVINEFAYVPLLVIDEIGVGFGTEAEAAQLFDVIDRRYQARNPLVLISNLSVPDLREALGDRLFDRIREASQVVPFNWPSHRGTASTPRTNTV
jgi:acyl-CoA synthetase (AMP-forming)/AMP-acid ligase II